MQQNAFEHHAISTNIFVMTNIYIYLSLNRDYRIERQHPNSDGKIFNEKMLTEIFLIKVFCLKNISIHEKLRKNAKKLHINREKSDLIDQISVGSAQLYRQIITCISRAKNADNICFHFLLDIQ